MRNWIDLHMHSCCSPDGFFTPETLTESCVRAGIRVAALTDHNSVKGVARMVQAAAHCDLTVIPAVELDCLFAGILPHILGYGIDIRDPVWHEHELETRAAERRGSIDMLRNLHALGLVFDDAQAYAQSGENPVEAVIIAEIALADPRNANCPILAPYRPGGARSVNPFLNFYWDFCAPGSPAHVFVPYVPLSRAIKMITDTGGVPILAHPGQNLGCDDAMLQKILAAGVLGVETDCSYHSAQTAAFYRQKVAELGVLRTIGSDFHGKSKPAVLLGDLDASGQEEIQRTLSDAMMLASAGRTC